MREESLNLDRQGRWAPSLAASCAALLAICLAPSAPARAADAVAPVSSSAASASETICVRFAGPWIDRFAAQVESDLRTALSRRRMQMPPDVCVEGERGGATGAAANKTTAASLTLIAGDKPEQVTITLVTREGRTLSRGLDLRPFPPDGRGLALVVASDELLQAAHDQATTAQATVSSGGKARAPGAPQAGGIASNGPSTAAAAASAATAARAAVRALSPEAASRPGVASPPAAAPSEAARPAPDSVASPSPFPASSPSPRVAGAVVAAGGGAAPGGRSVAANALAATFAFDHYAGGQTHVGPSIAWRRAIGGRVFVGVAGGEREGLSVDAASGAVTSRLWEGRLALGLFVPARAGRFSLAVDAGARAGWLRFQGRPVADAVGRAAAGAVVYADASLIAEARLAGPVALRLDAGAGAPLVGQSAAEGTRAITAASGVAIETQVGAVLLF